MTIGTLCILVGVVILFTLSVGIILSHKNRKTANEKKLTDDVVEFLDDTLRDEEIL